MSASRKMVIAIWGEATLAALIGNLLIGRNGFCKEGKHGGDIGNVLEGDFMIQTQESHKNLLLFPEKKGMPKVSTYCLVPGYKMERDMVWAFMKLMCDEEVSTLIYAIDLSNDLPSQIKRLDDLLKAYHLDQHNLVKSDYPPAVMFVGLQTSDALSLEILKNITNQYIHGRFCLLPNDKDFTLLKESLIEQYEERQQQKLKNYSCAIF